MHGYGQQGPGRGDSGGNNRCRGGGLPSHTGRWRPCHSEPGGAQRHVSLREAPPEPRGDALLLRGDVYVVETLGRENIVTVELSTGERVKVVTGPEEKPAGTVYITLPLARLMLFDPETGARIAP